MKKHRHILVYLAAYFLLNPLFLEQFPFVHSDEAWLSGLSRNMLEQQSFAVTEPFFDLLPRYPHAIKLLFHAMQIGFMQRFGYNLFAFRLLSLIFAAGCLLVFYLLSQRLTQNRLTAALCAVVLSLDIQFLYAAHFARQESIVLFFLVFTLYLLSGTGKHRFLLAGLTTGLCIGIHPNSFVIACAAGACFLLRWAYERKARPVELLHYAGVTGAFASVFVAISFLFDRSFPQHYLSYGSQFEVDAPIGSKLSELFPYFQRLFHRVSGTYYTPDIRLQLILFALIAFTGIAAFLFAPKLRESLLLPLSALAGLTVGFVLIGRYNQPYVIFFFPLCILIAGVLLSRIGERHAIRALCGYACVLLISSCVQIIPWIGARPYADYLADISAHVPSHAKVLGNLNAEYAFENGALLDYRNLAFLSENNLTLEQYIREREIEYLIVSDELSLIHRLRPAWNGIYGNIQYLEALDTFLAEHCEQVASFTDNLYGVRIVRFQNREERFEIRIYRVIQ